MLYSRRNDKTIYFYLILVTGIIYSCQLILIEFPHIVKVNPPTERYKTGTESNSLGRTETSTTTKNAHKTH